MKQLASEETVAGLSRSERDDYIHVVLTDEFQPIDALSALRAVYPNVMSISFDNARTAAAQEECRSVAEDVDRIDPIDLFARFYREQNGSDMTDVQYETVREALEESEDEGDEADPSDHVRVRPLCGHDRDRFLQTGAQRRLPGHGRHGAGKTTIFDAISFALFGKASGDDRDPKMLRSDFAAPTLEASVELEFEYRDRVYVVSRRPAQEREKLTGDGMTKVGAEASLTMPDGSVITGPSNVDRAVDNILGITRDQFARIVMIAQGDFRKLLSAKTEERRDIFRRIFGTERYQAFQESLAARKRALDSEHKALVEELKLHAKAVHIDEGTDEADELHRRIEADTLQAEWLRTTLQEATQRDAALLDESDCASRKPKRKAAPSRGPRRTRARREKLQSDIGLERSKK